MITRRPRGATALAATLLTLALAATGCGADGGGGGDGGDGGDGGGGTGGGKARTAPSTPPATGNGPYPSPSDSATTPAGTPGPGGPRPTGTPKGGTARPGDVEQTDADEMSRGALKALWTFDTTVDRRPQDAELRTAEAGWLTGAYADRLRAHRSRPVPGAQWQQWDDHRAYTTVGLKQTQDAAKPPDTETEAWRQWTVTATPTGRDRWRGDPVTVTAYVQLTRSAPGKPWRVAGITVP
ncbi:hypothetical protein [Streptomyces sp. NPDC048172]|uniref:hypothetical protein n=1 Tax=Streptomyces sp. NPDC048172 TaxID=3365505 RepID=UPI0037195D3A